VAWGCRSRVQVLNMMCVSYRWKGVIAPRMGQLLALNPPTDMPALTRGVMEMSYSKVSLAQPLWSYTEL
jgi:hypothetical protein